MGLLNLGFFVGGAVGSAAAGALSGPLGLEHALALVAILPLMAGALALLTAAIALWNAAHLPMAVEELSNRGEYTPEEMLGQLSPLGRERITLTGTYHWDLAATSALEGLLNDLR